MRRFSQFAAIDWSGARGERHKGIALALADRNGASALVRPGHIWSRREILEWLQATAAAGEDMLIGFDFSAAFAFADQSAYFPDWTESPCDMPGLWALVEQLSADDPHFGAASFLNHHQARRHFRHAKGDVGDLFQPGTGRLRLVEQHQRATRQAASVSNFNLVGAAQVGKASLCGMRLLHRLKPHMPFWPLDPVPPSGPLLVEIYTGVAARAAGLPPGRSKIRTAAALDAALAVLGSPSSSLSGPISDHEADAILTAAWLRKVADDAAHWSPNALTRKIAQTEGWTFGII